jgi:outer membrane protein assembly factor BamB
LPGAGASSPVIAGSRIFVTCWSGSTDLPGVKRGEQLKRHLVCVDTESGKLLWTSTVAGEDNPDPYQGFLQEHGYASQTPVTDGSRVYVYFGKAGALAFDFEGRRLWQTSLGNAANAKNWGSASSPIVSDKAVIINASEESHALYALDKLTGRQLWKSEAAALEYVFATPALVSHHGRLELVVAVPNQLWGLNPENGRTRWYAETGLSGNLVPSVVTGDGAVFAFGGFPHVGAVAFKLGGRDEVTLSHRLWTAQTGSYIPTPVLHQGRLYFASDAGFATCLDAQTGALVFKERLAGASESGRGGKPFYASAIVANGNVYAVSRRNGVFVFAAKPQFQLLARNRLASDEAPFNATPAVAGNQIFLRSDRYLYCIAADAGS